MNVLGRGLASLIPKRGREEAEDLIEQMDRVEVLEEEPSKVRALKQAQAQEAVSLKDPVEENEEENQVGRRVAVRDDEFTKVRVLKQAQTEEIVSPEASAEETQVARRVAVQEDADDGAVADPEVKPAQIDDDEIAAPTTPLVTPLTVDLKTGTLREVDLKPAPVAKKRQKPLEQKKVAEKKLQQTRKITQKKSPAKPQVALDDKELSLFEPVGENSLMLGKKVLQVSLGDIELNPNQPRRYFDKDELAELAQSLDQHGLLQPLVVTEKEDGTYMLIAGERRLRAAKQLKWKAVPCVVRQGVSTDRSRLELALTENIQRKNLSPIEEAMGLLQLHEEYGLTHDEVGDRVGKSRVSVTNSIRLLQLPAEIQRSLIEEKIAPGHARAILMIPDEQKQLRFHKHLLEEGLTVRKAEHRARRIQRTMQLTDPNRIKKRGRPALAMKYEAPLEDHFGHNVRVRFDHVKNRFEVLFIAYNETEATELIERLLGQRELPDKDVDRDVIED